MIRDRVRILYLLFLWFIQTFSNYLSRGLFKPRLIFARINDTMMPKKTASSLDAFNPLFNTGFIYLIDRVSRKSRRLELEYLRVFSVDLDKTVKRKRRDRFICVAVIYVIKVVKDLVQN